MNELVRQLRSRYLQNELRYDKYGALGKILLLEEILRGQGLRMKEISPYCLINHAFPRTFYCQKPRTNLNVESVKKEYQEISESMLMQEIDQPTVEKISLDEVAERFCASPNQILSVLHRPS
jgi:hypothetical protein